MAQGREPGSREGGAANMATPAVSLNRTGQISPKSERDLGAIIFFESLTTEAWREMGLFFEPLTQQGQKGSLATAPVVAPIVASLRSAVNHSYFTSIA